MEHIQLFHREQDSQASRIKIKMVKKLSLMKIDMLMMKK
ncbi:hypothetical protein Xedl_00987 [Xenorhabdus eapokensis]|uniref:Uncharacterized protein n=1 Tax=Xenorhabdus eapokensis TaxID=1873482 RepID=A0A1Q5TWL8_9GAMM|nr:hypothetical protein Xedl_00987 [Xenorhabdus eapokensis]